MTPLSTSPPERALLTPETARYYWDVALGGYAFYHGTVLGWYCRLCHSQVHWSAHRAGARCRHTTYVTPQGDGWTDDPDIYPRGWGIITSVGDHRLSVWNPWGFWRDVRWVMGATYVSLTETIFPEPPPDWEDRHRG